jgi:dTDP-4-dehydrorhamnose reductase
MTERPVFKILITGVYGQLGRAVAAACANRNLESEGRDIDTLDITDADTVTRWIESSQASAVVNCAAYTVVDRCEADEQSAMRVNGTAVGFMAAACNAVGARLIQISTDYVFKGDGTRPYREDDPPAPLSAYGRTKLRGEELAASANRSLIVRTAWLYGHGGRNFVEAIREQIQGGRRVLEVVADQRGSPTFCDDLARAILDLIDADADGVVHAVNSGQTSWHGFAAAIARHLKADVDVLPISSNADRRAASRPAYSVLDTSRLAGILGTHLPPWEDALNRYLETSCAS